MYSIFNPLVKQPLGTIVTSEATYNSVSAPSVQFNLVDKDPSTLVYKNGVIQSVVPFAVINGDKVKLSFKTSTEYATAVYVKYSIDGILGVLGASTIDSISVVLKPMYEGVSYLDTIYTSPGVEYLRDYSQNKFLKLDIGLNTISNILLHSTPTGVDVADYTYIIEPFNNFIFKINTATTQVIKKVSVGSNPSGGTNTVLPNTTDKCIWITVTDEHKIVCLNETDTIVETLSGFGKPIGIDSSADGKILAVANNDNANPSVSVLKYANSAWTKTDVVMPAKPYSVYVDVLGKIWVSLQNSDKTIIIDTNNTTSFITTGNGQRSLKAYDDNYIYVSCCEDKKLFKIDQKTKLISATYAIPEYPIDFAVTPTAVYVASGTKSIYKVDSVGTVSLYSSVEKTIYAIDTDESGLNLYCACLFYDQPEFIQTQDTVTSSFYYESPSSVVLNTVYESDSITISDIDSITPVSVPNIFGAKIYVNSVIQPSTNATIISGDNVKFSFDISVANNELIVFPVFIGNTVRMFSAVAKQSDVIPTPFYFDDVISANLTTEYTSNEIIVALNPPTGSANLLVSNAVIVKNDVASGSSTTVVEGDRIKLVATSDSKYSTIKYSKVQLAEYVNIWSIITKVEPGKYWISNNFKDDDLFIDGASSASINKISFINLAGTVTTSSLDVAPLNVHSTTLDYVYITNFYNNKLYKVVADTLELAALYSDFEASSKPFAVASVLSAADTFNGIAVTLTAKNKVRILAKDFSSFYDLDTQLFPHGIACSGTKLWLANTDSGTVSVYTFNVTTSKYEFTNAIAVGGKPYEIHYDEVTSKAYVTDILANKVHVLNDTSRLNSVNVGTNPWGLSISGNYLYCTNSYSNSVSQVNVTDFSVVEFILDQPPNSVTVDKDGFVYTTNLVNSEVRKYSSNFTYISSILTNNTNTWINSSPWPTSKGVFVAHLFADISANKLVLETSASSSQIVAQLAVPVNTIIESAPFTITGLTRKDTLYIENYTDAAFIVNGVELPAGQPTVIANGDIISVKILSSKYYNTDTYLAVSAKDYRREFHIRTEPDLVPDEINFIPAYGVIVGETLTSNEKFITGLTDGVLTTVTVSPLGVVMIVNGIRIDYGASVDVTNGDSIQLEWISDMSYGAIETITLTAKDVAFGFYKVFAISLNGPVVWPNYVNWTEVTATWEDAQALTYNAQNSLAISLPISYDSTILTVANDRLASNRLSTILSAPVLTLPILKLANVVTSPDLKLPSLSENSLNLSPNVKIPEVAANRLIEQPVPTLPSVPSYSINYSGTARTPEDSKKHIVTVDIRLVPFVDTNTKQHIANRDGFIGSYNYLLGAALKYDAVTLKNQVSTNNFLGTVDPFIGVNFVASFKYFVPELNNLNSAPTYQNNDLRSFDSWDPKKEFVKLEFANPVYISPVYTIILVNNIATKTPEYECPVYSDIFPITPIYKALQQNVSFALPPDYSVLPQHASFSLDPIYEVLTGSYGFNAIPTYIVNNNVPSPTKQPTYEVLKAATLSSLPKTYIAGSAIYSSIISTAKLQDNTNWRFANLVYVKTDYAGTLSFDRLNWTTDNTVFTDNNLYSAMQKGSYDSSTINSILSTDIDYEQVTLSDGTLLYSYPNKIEYGECVTNRYIIEYGFVRGG